jgi:hypothetical protein
LGAGGVSHRFVTRTPLVPRGAQGVSDTVFSGNTILRVPSCALVVGIPGCSSVGGVSHRERKGVRHLFLAGTGRGGCQSPFLSAGAQGCQSPFSGSGERRGCQSPFLSGSAGVSVTFFGRDTILRAPLWLGVAQGVSVTFFGMGAQGVSDTVFWRERRGVSHLFLAGTRSFERLRAPLWLVFLGAVA